jgi:hypothetical protein
MAFEANAEQFRHHPFSDNKVTKSSKSETTRTVISASFGGLATRLDSTAFRKNENARGWSPLVAQAKKIPRPRARFLWPARLNLVPAWVKDIRPKLGSFWPFAMPTGLTILPSLETARLYPWWAATLVFNAVWITLRLWDDRARARRYNFFRRAVHAIGIVILADTLVLATTIDVCSADNPGCISAFFMRQVAFVSGRGAGTKAAVLTTQQPTPAPAPSGVVPHKNAAPRQDAAQSAPPDDYPEPIPDDCE